MKFLIYGGKGWIGSKLITIVSNLGHEIILGKARLQDYPALKVEISTITPDFVLNAAGITGNPTVDSCEDHKQETIFINTVGVVNLAHACFENNCHLTNYATGCIYNNGKFSENDEPNFQEST